MRMSRIALVALAMGCAGTRATDGDTGASATSPDSGSPAPNTDGGTPPPPQHTLSVAIDGQGTVTSTPAGISCPGTCSAAFDEGTTIALTETPAPGQAFVLWSSACSGGRDCAVALGGDTQVGARFRMIPPNRCAGLAIPALPSSATATVLAWDMDPASCGGISGDGSGNLYSDTYYVLSNQTKHLLSRAFLFVTLNAGFAAFSHQMAPVGSLTAYTPDGVALSSTPMYGYMSTGGVQFNGGIVGVDADCNDHTGRSNRRRREADQPRRAR